MPTNDNSDSTDLLFDATIPIINWYYTYALFPLLILTQIYKDQNGTDTNWIQLLQRTWYLSCQPTSSYDKPGTEAEVWPRWSVLPPASASFWSHSRCVILCRPPANSCSWPEWSAASHVQGGSKADELDPLVWCQHQVHPVYTWQNNDDSPVATCYQGFYLFIYLNTQWSKR